MRNVSYLILGKEDVDWGMDYELINADASFIGEDEWDRAGYSIAGIGDINGDGYDDFIIGVPGDEEGGMADGYGAGQTYLILGRSEADWGIDYNLSNADASFIGENPGDGSGNRVADIGDINTDGYDDFVIVALRNNEGGIGAGKTYLFLGKNSIDWGMDYNLVNADASFIGEDSNDKSGVGVSGAGDVNNDGYDDFLIGASGNDEGGYRCGQAYLILGNPTAFWGMSYNLGNADASFIGEAYSDGLGTVVSDIGDVNGDAYDDFLIGAQNNDEGGDEAGQTYLIFGKAEADWGMGFNISNSDVSFIGENEDDYSSNSLSGVGDVNNDGYDDFLIGAFRNDENGNMAGQTYLILSDGFVPGPKLFITSTSINFGIILVGINSDTTLTVTNQGEQELQVTSIECDNYSFGITPTFFSLLPDEEQNLIVTFLPSQPTIENGIITIFSNDLSEPEIILPVIGEGNCWKYDIDCDGQVNIKDVQLIIEHWGELPSNNFD